MDEALIIVDYLHYQDKRINGQQVRAVHEHCGMQAGRWNNGDKMIEKPG